MRSRFRALATILAAVAVGCGAHSSSIQSNAPLGRVVIYRNGVAYYERQAAVTDGKLMVRVPRDRVDDFLKSLTVVDNTTGAALPITIPRKQADDGQYLTMALETPTDVKAQVKLTYVTESPAWKPSYRIVVEKNGTVMLQGWAVVDNTSGEDWRGVRVGVGASSALSFRYDLWSVRNIDRETLAEEEHFAVAPPTGLSPYGGGAGIAGATGTENGGLAFDPGSSGGTAVELDDNEIRRRPGDAAGLSYSGSSSLENRYHIDGAAGATGTIQGVVSDAATGEPMIGTTVVAESPALQGTQTAITDEKGGYTLRSLPPGPYSVTFYYNDAVVRRTDVVVAVNKATPVFQKMRDAGGGETIALIEQHAPQIDTTSTTQGITLSQDYVTNVPIGRTFNNVMGSSPGSSSDSSGASYEPPVPTPADGDRKIAALIAQLGSSRRGVVIQSHAEAGIPGAASRARDRANVVRNQLIDAGIAPSRIAIEPHVGGGEPELIRLRIATGPLAEARTASAHGASASTTDDTPVGESHFLAERPMNVAAGASAMVSVLREPTKGGVVYLYDPLSERGNTRFAFRAVRLDNPTDDTLEPGPVTVYGDKRFIGEGLTDSIPPHATAVVPFALDRQIVIDRSEDGDDEIAKLVTLERGVLTVEVQHVRRTRLAISSRLHETTTLYIRHQVGDGWILKDHPEVTTRTGDSHLFAVSIPAGETREVLIAEATPMQRTLQLASPSALGMLEVYVKSAAPGTLLKERLTELVATHRGMADTVEKIQTLRDQLAEYRQRSDELHAQVLSLRAVKTGGTLLKVLKQKLAEMSERVQQGTLDLVDAQEALLIAKTEFANQLAELRLPDQLATK
jgi:hypothetical protein